MIAVRLYKGDAGRREEVGKLEFFGVPLGEPSDRALVAVTTSDGRRCEGQVNLTPAGIATDSEIKAIAASLCHDAKSGKAERYEWELVSHQHLADEGG
jgi:hypothetical protein